MIVRGERCPRCSSPLVVEQDERHAHQTVTCMAGHLIRYIGPDGATTAPITENRPKPEPGKRAPRVTKPAAPLLSTREWVRDALGEQFLPAVEHLDEGTYGEW